MRGLTMRRGGEAAGFVMAALALAAMGWSQDTWAAPMDARAVNCVVNIGGVGPSGTIYSRYNSAAFQVVLQPPQTTLPIPANPAPNQVLMTMQSFLPEYYGGAQGNAAPYYNCPPGALERFSSLTSAGLVPGFANLYRTSLEGVGFRVAYYHDASGGETVYAPVEYVNEYSDGVLVFPFNGSQFGASLMAMIELVATGEPISPGVISGAMVSAQSVMTAGGSVAAQTLYKVSMGQSVTLSVPTCTAPPAQPGLTMTLPDVSTTDLLRDGQGPMSDTTIAVNCSAPLVRTPSVTINSPYLIPGTTNALSNVSPDPGKAEGVGVEVWLGSDAGDYTRPTFGQAYDGLGIAVGALPTSSWNFLIGARLLQVDTANSVRSGPVRATATLTFTYD